MQLVKVSYRIAANVKRLGEGRDIEFRLLTLLPILNKDIKFSLCSPALLLPSQCWWQLFLVVAVVTNSNEFSFSQVGQ
jgi:hypothetical protein